MNILEHYLLEDTKVQYPKEFALHEGLIMTHPVDDAMSIIHKAGYEIVDNKSTKFGVKCNSNRYKTIKRLLQLTNNLGWFPSTIQLYPMHILNPPQSFSQERMEEYIYEFDTFVITFEPKFDFEIEDIPAALYHFTLKKNLDRIMKQGLTPRENGSKRTFHPPRIYVTDRLENAESFAKIFNKERFNPKSNKVDDYGKGVILKIVTSTLPKFCKLYIDPNYKGKGYFLINSIPPTSIKIVKEVDVIK